jgi:hypothetical protein
MKHRLSTFICFIVVRMATASIDLSWSAFDLIPRPTCANQITLGDPECLFVPKLAPYGYTMGNDSSISVYTDSWGIQRCISWHWSCPHNLEDDSLLFGIQVPGRISCAHPSLVVNSTSITDVDVHNATSRPNGLITPTGM